MKKLLQKWLGIDKDLELERYVSTQEKLTEATEALAKKTKLNADEIAGLKEALEYITKDLVEIKKASKK